MMDSSRLWAKSKQLGESECPSAYLAVHLQDVYRAARQVLSATLTDQLTALGLGIDHFGERVRRVVLLAAAVHDLGKANDHFQGMICGKRDIRSHPQGVRHEWVTILLLQQLKDWLISAVGGNEADFAVVQWAVAGHHRDEPPWEVRPGSGTQVLLLVSHPDFAHCLDWLADTFPLHNVPRFASDEMVSLIGSSGVPTRLKRWRIEQSKLFDRFNSTERRFVASVKASLIAADVAGSALPRQLPNDEERWQQIGRAFANKPKPDDLQFVVDWRLKREELRGGDGRLRPFQEAVAASRSIITYVKAGCGTGKTLAAYQWAASQHPQRRLFFCYPTTGTATEGFKDYLFQTEVESEADDPDRKRLQEIGAELFHSRRDVDFEVILTAGKDLDSDKSYSGAERDAIARLESLEVWSTPVVACTVDTVLGLVQNNRRGLFAWPALAQSAFVFDEIHAFDDRLFGALLRFLRDLPGLPVLLMTASLPQTRLNTLRETLSARNITLELISGPKELEELPRYHKAERPKNDVPAMVRNTVQAGGKVLWVCNTVQRVLDAANQMSGVEPLLYHSRFKYEDRVERHKATVDAFTTGWKSGGALAICSQVAEMSLDLSADLLVTDLAPVSALIQRLGRLNRRAKQGDPTRPFVVIEPNYHLPYTSADLGTARTWLGKLPAENISQCQLSDTWENVADQPTELVSSAWLDGGPNTLVCDLRESSPGITVLMEQDLPRLKRQPKDFARLILPMPDPRSMNWQSWTRYRALPVAPAGTIEYDPLRGAEWRK